MAVSNCSTKEQHLLRSFRSFFLVIIFSHFSSFTKVCTASRDVIVCWLKCRVESIMPNIGVYAALCGSQTALTQLCLMHAPTWPIPFGQRKILHLCSVITLFTFSFNWNQFGERIIKRRCISAYGAHFLLVALFVVMLNAIPLNWLDWTGLDWVWLWRYVVRMPFCRWLNCQFFFFGLMCGILFIFIFQYYLFFFLPKRTFYVHSFNWLL